MSDTPETDAIADFYLLKAFSKNPADRTVPCQFAARLERDLNRAIRERDEARESLKHIAEYGTEEINAAVELRQKLANALVDLDNMQDQRDLTMKVIKRLERERDEAREKLDEEMKWHHRTHQELVEAQCKLLDIEYDKLKS